MLKKLVGLSLIYSVFLLTSFPVEAFAQTQSNPSKKEQVSQKPNVKKAFTKEISKSKLAASETSVDFNKIEKDQYKKVQKKGLTGKEKTLIVVIIAAAVIGAIILWKYVKVPKCSQVDCDPDFDENCICQD